MASESSQVGSDTILKTILPSSFESKIIEQTIFSSEKFKCELRTSATTVEEAKQWLLEFGQKTNTCWIVKKTIPVGKLVYRAVFDCQHSATNKTTNIKKQTGRNTNCSAQVLLKIKKVNRGTIKNDSYLKLSCPLPCIININFDHNHNIVCHDAFRMLRVTPEVRERFHGYFSDGLTASAAKHHHEADMLKNPNHSAQDLANAALNPCMQTVQYIFRTWRDNKYGDSSSMYQKLKDKKTQMEEQGVFLDFEEGPPFAIVLVTALFKRAQELRSSGEIIFLDSTGSCDSTQTSVTTFLTATKAGAVPLAILMHEGLTEESYEKAFRLLKRHFPRYAGGMSDGPGVFMTDDSAAEKNALKTVWPQSHQLLCLFHLPQSVWRWLWDADHKIPKDDRPKLMGLFQEILRAMTSTQGDEALKALKSAAEAYPAFIDYVEALYQRKDEWAMFCRKEQRVLTRGHDTNNFAEASVRIFKDVILNRLKAYNPIALVDFFSTDLVEYFKVRLLDSANNRNGRLYNQAMISNALYKDSTSLPKNPYHRRVQQVLQRASSIPEEDISQLSESQFAVRSQTEGNAQTYRVDTEVGVCSCAAGVNGQICKHQAAVMSLFATSLPNAPLISQKERHELAKLALEEEDCPDISFYVDFLPSTTLPGIGDNSDDGGLTSLQSTASANSAESSASETCQMEDDTAEPVDTEESLNTVKSARAERLQKKWEKFFALLEDVRQETIANGDVGTEKGLDKMITCFSKSNGGIGKINHFLHTTFWGKCRTKFGRKIRVQPTAVSRRKEGTTRGTTVMKAGRPRKTDKRRGRQKAPRNLALSIAKNRPNAKSHGSGH